MNDNAFWPGTKVLRGDSRPPGAQDAGLARRDDRRAITIKLLNQALMIARMGALRCERQYFAALRGQSPALAAAALDHANEAQTHADDISRRIAELGGKPDSSLDGAAQRAVSEQRNGTSLATMIGHHLATERVTIKIYREIVAAFSSFDRPSQELIERIIIYEEECASDLARLLEELSPRDC
ncbi:MAG: ferritin-like domain-containing protein [Vicinamibacterales bacterium]